VVPTTAIIDIGGVVLANSAYLAPPYQVAAIGSENLYEDVVGSRASPTLSALARTGYGIRIGYLEPRRSTSPRSRARSPFATPARAVRAARRAKAPASGSGG
jgi:hypothetical protein